MYLFKFLEERRKYTIIQRRERINCNKIDNNKK